MKVDDDRSGFGSGTLRKYHHEGSLIMALGIHQIKLKKMETFCYLLADEATRTGALVDPAFETKRILQMADQAGCTVRLIINTHGHFDHVSGNGAIKAATQARLMIHTLDAPALSRLFNRIMSGLFSGKRSPKADVHLNDNDVIEIGDSSINVIHTPGHTKGSICLYTAGHLITGDTLFVGAVGRTDLPGGSHRRLIQSIHDRLYALPEETVVWPGHDYGSERSSTIKREKNNNPFTQPHRHT